jgi:hypothetical protein
MWAFLLYSILSFMHMARLTFITTKQPTIILKENKTPIV